MSGDELVGEMEIEAKDREKRREDGQP